MINIPIDVIIEKITEQTDLKEEEVQNKINSKLEQLSGLISKEGAAHIVANELGVKLMQTEGVMKIKEPHGRHERCRAKLQSNQKIRP
jgi:hypothetical protein